MYLRMLAKLQEFEHMWWRQLVLELPKGVPTSFIPLLGYPFLKQVREDPSNLSKVLNQAVIIVVGLGQAMT